MSDKLLLTKLSKPDVLKEHINRKRLTSAFKEAGDSDLFLVSAPAGTGKTTAVSQWLQDLGKPFMWYSLDDWDNEIHLFFSYIIEGLKPIDDRVYQELGGLLDGMEALGIPTFIRSFIMTLHQIRSPWILVLDDYHLVDNKEINQCIQKLVEHLPKTLQIVLITREDPDLKLGKLRVSGKLMELRLGDLNLSEEEASEMLKRYNSQISTDQERLLYERTEGWAAGLQLAAVSMKNMSDPGAFIADFSGNHLYIMDYLMEEVLADLDQDLSQFLLESSCLEYFNSDMCDAVLELSPGKAEDYLSQLEDANLFLIGLEGQKGWYRYHHLFRDILRERLKKDQRYKKIQENTGDWYRNRGNDWESMHYYLRCQAYDKAAIVAELTWAEMDLELKSITWVRTVKKIPEDQLMKRPVLAMAYGWGLLDDTDYKEAGRWLDIAGKLYKESQMFPDRYEIHDQRQYRMLEASLESAYGFMAAGQERYEEVFPHAVRTLELVPEDEYHKYGVASMLLGFAYWSGGDLAMAEETIGLALGHIKKEVNLLTLNSFYMILAELKLHQHKPDQAYSLFEDRKDWLLKSGQVPILIASFYLGMAKAVFFKGDLDKSLELLETSKSYGQKFAIMDWEYKYYLLLARIYALSGFYDMAKDALLESRHTYYINPIPDDVTIDELDDYIRWKEKATVLMPGKDRDMDEVMTALIDKVEPQHFSEIGNKKKEVANESLAEPLTVRELEVLDLIAEGLSNKEICDSLFLALSTVKGYIQNIYGKLGVRRRTEAIKYAQSMGLIE